MLYFSGFIHYHHPSVASTLASMAFSQFLEYAKHTSSSRPLNLLFRLPGTLFLRDIYSCFLISFSSPLKHLLIVKPSLNNGRKIAQGSPTSPLFRISLILLHFCSLFFLSPPDIFYDDFSLSAFALLGALFCLFASPATRTMPGIW